jgi:hypothetical protein
LPVFQPIGLWPGDPFLRGGTTEVAGLSRLLRGLRRLRYAALRSRRSAAADSRRASACHWGISKVASSCR